MHKVELNKFIEVEVVQELINNDVQDSVGVCWASSCEFSSTVNTQGMSCSEDPDALQEMYGIYYEGLYGTLHTTTDAIETPEKIQVVENVGRGCILETHEFVLYTENGKKYILRDEYEQVWPADD